MKNTMLLFAKSLIIHACVITLVPALLPGCSSQNKDALPDASVTDTGTGTSWTPEGPDGWEFIALPQDAVTSALWMAPNNEVFTVGRVDISTSGPAVFRLNGGEWDTFDLSQLNYFDGYYDNCIWGRSETDVYIARKDRHDSVAKRDGVVAHFNGNNWSIVRDTYSFHDVWVFDDGKALAVGYFTLAEFDGSNWNIERKWDTGQFTSVWGCAYNDAYAASYPGTQGGPIWHFDGSAWTPLSEVTYSHIGQIWGLACNDIWAAGDRLLHYNGVSWQAVNGPESLITPGFGVGHFGVIGGTGPNDLFISVTATKPEGESYILEERFLSHYDGSTWEKTDDALFPLGTMKIWGTGPNDKFFLVRSSEGVSLRHFDGSVSNEISSVVTDAMLTGTAVTDANDIYLSGYDNVIIHYDGLSWTHIDAGVVDDFPSISASASGRVVAVGRSGSIAWATDGVWEPANENSCQEITELDGDDNYLYAQCGGSGSIVRFDENIWEDVPLEETLASTEVRDIAVSTTGDVFAVGSMNPWPGGWISHLNAGHWTSMDFPVDSSSTLYGFSRASVIESGDLALSGVFSEPSQQYLLGVFNGETWTQFTNIDGYASTELWGSSLNDLVIIGKNGYLATISGGIISEETFEDLFMLDMAGNSAGNVAVLVRVLGQTEGPSHFIMRRL